MNMSMTIGFCILGMSLSTSIAMAENIPPPQGPYTSIQAMKILPSKPSRLTQQSSYYDDIYHPGNNNSNEVNQRQIETDNPRQEYEQSRMIPPLQRQSQSSIKEMRNIPQYTQPNVQINPAYPVRRGPVYGPTSLPPANYTRPAYPAYPVQNRMNTYPQAWR